MALLALAQSFPLDQTVLLVDNDTDSFQRTQERAKIVKRELQSLVTQMHSSGVSYNEAVRQFKRRYIFEILAQHKGNQCKAAEELGMHRNTLSRLLADLEMDSTQIRKGIRAGMRRPPASERSAISNLQSIHTGTR